MRKTNLFRLLLSLLVALPFTAWAQVDVNRAMYPDYSDKLNPDWSMLETATGAKRANESTASTRPAYVNNAEQKYFPLYLTKMAVLAVRHRAFRICSHTSLMPTVISMENYPKIIILRISCGCLQTVIRARTSL